MKYNKSGNKIEIFSDDNSNDIYIQTELTYTNKLDLSV